MSNCDGNINVLDLRTLKVVDLNDDVLFFVDNNTKHVGIGTLTPQAQLDVVGTIRTKMICDESGNNCRDISSGWPINIFSVSGNDAYYDNGNVGIGTTSPEALLDVDNPSSGTALTVGRITNSPSIAARSDATGGWIIMDSTGSGNVGLNYYDDGDVILVKGGGNVGIGIEYANHRPFSSGISNDFTRSTVT